MEARLRTNMLWGAVVALVAVGCADAKGNKEAAQESNIKTAKNALLPRSASTLNTPNATSSLGTDPGPRAGAAGAGGPFAGLSAAEQAIFTAAQEVFEEVDS